MLTQILVTRWRGATLSELAGEFETCQRTISRDLDDLRSVGFPIEETKEEYNRKRWRLNGGGNKPPQITYNLEEAAALYLGRRFLEPLAIATDSRNPAFLWTFCTRPNINGAAFFQTRKGPSSQGSNQGNVITSMEPVAYNWKTACLTFQGPKS